MIRRTFNQKEINSLKEVYGNKINCKNITSLRRGYVYKTLKKLSHKNRTDYITHSIIEWWKTVEFSRVNYSLLMKLVRRYKIVLYEEEKDQQLIHEETLFSVGRKLKMIPVNSDLEENETAYIKYRDVYIRKLNEGEFNKGVKGDLIITNLAAHHINSVDDIYRWDTIKKFQFTEQGFVFVFKGETFMIELYDGKVLQVIMTNFFSKKRKDMFEKEKKWEY